MTIGFTVSGMLYMGSVRYAALDTECKRLLQPCVDHICTATSLKCQQEREVSISQLYLHFIASKPMSPVTCTLPSLPVLFKRSAPALNLMEEMESLSPLS